MSAAAFLGLGIFCVRLQKANQLLRSFIKLASGSVAVKSLLVDEPAPFLARCCAAFKVAFVREVGAKLEMQKIDLRPIAKLFMSKQILLLRWKEAGPGNKAVVEIQLAAATDAAESTASELQKALGGNVAVSFVK